MLDIILSYSKAVKEHGLVLNVKSKPTIIYASPHLNHYSVESSAGKLKKVSSNGKPHITALTFTYRELAIATTNFSAECLLGEGGFGRVFKGHLQNINRVNIYF